MTRAKLALDFVAGCAIAQLLWNMKPRAARIAASLQSRPNSV